MHNVVYSWVPGRRDGEEQECSMMGRVWAHRYRSLGVGNRLAYLP